MKIRLKILLFIFFISPLFWQQLAGSPQKFLTEYSHTSFYFQQKISTIFNNTQYIDEFRWNDATKDNRPVIGKLFYNKAKIAFDQIIVYLNLLNPSLYFQVGKVEILSCLLFPISFAGIFRLIKNKQNKLLLIGLLSCIFAFLTGQQNIYFLLPTAIFYLYFSAYELSFWKKKSLFWSLGLLFIYSSFLFLRLNLIL
jgi:hypothetical protein